MGAAVGEPDEKARIGDERTDGLGILVEDGEIEERLEPVLEGDVEECVGAVDLPRVRDVGDGLSSERHHGRRGRIADGDARPQPARAPALELRLPLGPERSAPVQRALLGDRAVVGL